LVSFAVPLAAFTVYWFLVYRMNRVRWGRFRSKDELRLIVGRAGFIRAFCSGLGTILLAAALGYRPGMAVYFGSRLGYVAQQIPIVVVVWALLAWMISTRVKTRLDDGDAGPLPK
jgi:hypothetical protein